MLLRPLALAVFFGSVFAADHPRLLVSPTDVAALRARAASAPYTDMVARLKASQDEASANEEKSILYDVRPRNLAALYVITGDSAHAKAAEELVVAMVNDQTFWNNGKSKGLTRAAGALTVSLAFDLCSDAWSPDNRSLVSRELREAADGLMKSMGQSANTSIANNWQAVRYGSAGLAYLASDEAGGEDGARKAYAKLKDHLNANLGSNGWNPEGIGYLQYPWQFTGPFGIAAQRAGIGDLRADLPKVGLTFWTTYAGTVPIKRLDGLGLRHDLGDDHPTWQGGGTAGLGFWYMPEAQRPAARWMYDRLCGAEGDRSWDSSSGGGLYSVLYYPADLKPVNPASGPGLTYTDTSHGIAIFRNRFQDADDITLLVNGHSRQPDGCHGGPDTNTIRLLGLGSGWITGGGRTGNPNGQTNLFPGSPGTKAPGGLGKLESTAFNPDGSGIAISTGSCMGTTDHRRVTAIDFDPASGASAVIVMAETSGNGSLWRLNTPEFNTVATDDRGFTLTAPNGATLRCTVIQPTPVACEKGSVERGGGAGHAGYRYGDRKWINNTWIQFPCSQQVLTVFTLQPKGVKPPAITGSGTATKADLQVGKRAITVDGDQIRFTKR